MKNISVLRIIILTILFSGCSHKNIVQGPIQILDTENPTVKEIQFQLKDSLAVNLALRITNVKSRKEFVLEDSKLNLEHKALVPGLKSNQEFDVELLQDGDVVSDKYRFKTNPIDTLLIFNKKQVISGNALDGYILSQQRGKRDGFVYMMDAEGDVVWFQKVPAVPILSHWSENEEVIVLLGDPTYPNNSGDQIIAYNLDGTISWKIDLKKQKSIAHHEVFDRNGAIYTLIFDTIPNVFKGQMVKNVSSSIVKMNTNGDFLQKWSPLKDFQNQDSTSLVGDWGHANAFNFDDDGNILISYRDWNQIWKIDASDASKIWILGENGDFEMEKPLFDSQHAILKDNEGNYMLFDNGLWKQKTSVLSYKLEGKQALLTHNISLSSDLFSMKWGNAVTMPNGNILVCASGSSAIVILSPKGEVLYRVTTSTPPPYRATYVPSKYKSNS